EEKDHQNDDALDRLLLVQSDLSALTHQIDELVLQAFKCQGKATKEVESFPNFLSEMLSSLKSPNNADTDSQLLITGHLLDNHINFSISKEDDGQGGIHPIKTSSLHKPAGGSFAMIESTPIWKEAESVVRVGKYPGENTLKRELWTKFEVASINGV
ncbi:hypothetical protein C1H46_002125, partial [Malus baccata]